MHNVMHNVSIVQQAAVHISPGTIVKQRMNYYHNSQTTSWGDNNSSRLRFLDLSCRGPGTICASSNLEPSVHFSLQLAVAGGSQHCQKDLQGEGVINTSCTLVFVLLGVHQGHLTTEDHARSKSCKYSVRLA